MTEPILIALVVDIKKYLHITWVDENTDDNIKEFIKGGEERLQKIAGASLDFSVHSLHRTLLFDYCRYANSQALEMFEKNFSSELMSLHINTQVDAYIPEVIA